MMKQTRGLCSNKAADTKCSMTQVILDIQVISLPSGDRTVGLVTVLVRVARKLLSEGLLQMERKGSSDSEDGEPEVWGPSR